MEWRVAFSSRSRLDLEAIVRHIATDDPLAAERFGLRLISRAERLASFPQIGVALRERPGTRFIPCGPYLIIYRLALDTRTVRILRFWHGARGNRPRC